VLKSLERNFIGMAKLACAVDEERQGLSGLFYLQLARGYTTETI